jgi:multicomponent Na+:H+ antiporter subunit A
VQRVLRIRPTTFLGVGLLFAIGTGLVPLVLGDEFLESAIFKGTVPVIGDMKGSSVLFFDIGVYLVVLGMVLLLLEQLGTTDGVDRSDEEVSP